MPLATLPMYDLPEIRSRTDAWWQGLVRAFREVGLNDVPESLTRQTPYEPLWTDRNLLFGQTCGYPLTHGLKGRVRLLATPSYAVAGCDGGRYHSVVVVPAQSSVGGLPELRGSRCAVNGWHSHSGMNALRYLLAPLASGKRFFAEVKLSGGHANSIAMVGSGEADVAAIDCVTFALLSRHRPELTSKVQVLCTTESAPGLPYIASAAVPLDDVDRIRKGLAVAVQDPDLSDVRRELLIDGMAFLPISAYGRIDEMERAASDLGFPLLQ